MPDVVSNGVSPSVGRTPSGAAGALAASPPSVNASPSSASPSLPPLRSSPLPTSPRGLKAHGTTRSLNVNAETERKRRLIHRVPLLKQLLQEQHCMEEQLIQASKFATFADGEYIYVQGHPERDLFFIEDGKVLITQRRTTGTAAAAATSASVSVHSMPARRRSVQEAMMEVQIQTHHELEYFGELALLQNKVARKYNAVASGAVACLVLPERDFDTLLKPFHALLLYRHLLRAHCVLEKDRMFKELSPPQRQYLIDRCHLQAYADGEYICRQGECDDRYFILAEGEAEVVLQEDTHSVVESESSSESRAASTRELRRSTTTVVAHKSLFQSFGEMGLLDKPRTADVVAKGDTLCIVINRRHYIATSQLSGPTSAIDSDAEALLATTLIEEWKLVINARNLHLSNPHVAHYLVTFIQQFKAAYNQKFAGKTLYLDLFRRLHQEPQLTEEFEFVSARITWDSPSSSLGIIRSETRRVLSKPPAERSPDETSFVGRLIEQTAFLAKFDVPGPHIDRHKLARCLAKVVTFANISKDTYLFRQGKIESRAFLILRGKINIVNEDVTTASSTIKHYEVIATLSAGDSFGELSLVTRLQRSATTMAACDTDLLVFDRDHLQYVLTALPGVNVQQVMVKRAEFLSRLSFFKGCDFGQCIRVAHDLQEATQEARHLFLQETAHQRSLYIVKEGEIGVFMKIQVPSSSSSASPGTAAAAASKSVLVRVATIGAQEFFGVAITTVNPTVSVAASGGSTSPMATSNPSVHSPTTKQWDLGAAVYMSTTRVVVLELSERGWRRLSPTSLLSVRNALIERHQWNESVAKKQQEHPKDGLVPPAHYHVDRPWQQLFTSIPLTGDSLAISQASSSAPATASQPNSQLARHLKDKRTMASPYARLFPSADGHSGPTPPPKSPRKANETRDLSTFPTSGPAIREPLALGAWGWRSPFRGSVGSSPASSPSNRPMVPLGPMVSFDSKPLTSTTSPTAFSIASTLSLLPSPPRGDRQALLSIANLSPRSAAVAAQAAATKGQDANQDTSTAMWKARIPATRRGEYHAP